MKRLAVLVFKLGIIGALLAFSSCTEGVDDYPDAAKVSGYVFTDETETQGVQGVSIILESDTESETAYLGPDRWCYTDENGYFEGFLNLGSTRNAVTGDISYQYFGDVRISYFYNGQSFSWGGGATVQAGGNFLCPEVYLTQFLPIGTGGGG